MGPFGSIQLVFWAALLCSTVLCYANRGVMVTPQSPTVEIGKNFTATCALTGQASRDVGPDDLYWELKAGVRLPRETYARVNDTAASVTFVVAEDTPSWLLCKCDVNTETGPRELRHGIILTKGYPPEIPSRLSCVASQDVPNVISPVLTCTWEPGKRGTGELVTNYTLSALLGTSDVPTTNDSKNNSGQIRFDIFPHLTALDIWVEASNALGRVESEHLYVEDANRFVKTDPPFNVSLISENNLPGSLLMTWTPPIGKIYVRLKYQIRYCPAKSAHWTQVPLEDTSKNDIQSFRLQSLRADTRYVCQVRCKHYLDDGYEYWSDWSSNTSTRTPEDKPKSPPDVWRVITPGDSANTRRVEIISKDPVLSNGRIRSFDIRVKATSDWEQVPVNHTGSEQDWDWDWAHRDITSIKTLELRDTEPAYIEVVANNSVGRSPKALMVITRQKQKLPPVDSLTYQGDGVTLRVQWQPPTLTDPLRYVSHYVVEWVGVSGGQLDWKRELGNTTSTNITGELQRFKRYNISVYPIYNHGWVGEARTRAAYLEQGAPLAAPSVKIEGRAGSTEAVLEWKDVPVDKQRGFITNYTVFYSTNDGDHKGVVVSADTYQYKLSSLSSNTKYQAWIMASTERGSTNGTEHSFSTLKYAPGRIEGIVVGVCLGFLFLVVLTMLLCIYKKDTIKKNFWPQIPNPGSSSIGTWSPDFPSKADTPNEDPLTDVSVVKVSLCDAEQDDRTVLPLKKDKYLSEEHSSGIGGDSSCTSSPRQSVSDSDEGVESQENTASTVQYSSVVAANATSNANSGSSGYKGQNPALFSRSESTQPLLDGEENPVPDTPDAGVPAAHSRFPLRSNNNNNPCFGETEEETMEPTGGSSLLLLKFCPTTEEEEAGGPAAQEAVTELAVSESAEGSRRPASSYKPQLGGYRPQ